MYPAQCDIQVYRGDYFEMTLRLYDGTLNQDNTYTRGAPKDLTGWVPKAEIRATVDSTGPPLASFTVELLDQVNPTTKGGVHIYLPAAQSGALSVTSAVWDVQFTDSLGRVFTYLRGKVSIDKDVTR